MAVIRATIERIVREEGRDFVDIFTDHPEVKKLGTKDRDRIEQAVAAKAAGREVGIDYTHAPSKNINPYTNKPYDNYYFNGIIDEPEPAADDGIEVVPKPTRAATDPKEAWRITLAAGAKLAVGTLPLMPEDQRDFETQKRIALAWGSWLFTTPLPRGAAEPEDFGFGDEPTGSNPLDDPNPYIDDDWPPRG